MRSFRFILLILIAVLGFTLLPNVAERDWGAVLFGVLLIGALVFWYRALKRRS
jgi:hypothetical protein